jgi:hypothetical protein
VILIVQRRPEAMPFSKCPNCGQSGHLLVETDLPGWYAKHAPGKKVGEVVSMLCFKCWKASQNADRRMEPMSESAFRFILHSDACVALPLMAHPHR